MSPSRAERLIQQKTSILTNVEVELTGYRRESINNCPEKMVQFADIHSVHPVMISIGADHYAFANSAQLFKKCPKLRKEYNQVDCIWTTTIPSEWCNNQKIITKLLLHIIWSDIKFQKNELTTALELAGRLGFNLIV